MRISGDFNETYAKDMDKCIPLMWHLTDTGQTWMYR